MRAYELHRDGENRRLVLTEAPMPQPGPGEVRVKIVAASLNYRDLIVASPAASTPEGRIPLSDGAGFVEALGAGVTRWKIGDAVANSFFRDWIEGPYRTAFMAASYGGASLDGVLAEYVVFPEQALVAAPAHLTLQEAACLPCAAVTAWQALVVRGGLQAGQTLLAQGTGGVALFGLQFAKALGAKTILLSSSDEKRARAEALGAAVTLNYQDEPDWDRAVLAATNGQGVDHLLELGGPDTYARSLNALGAAGHIFQIGVLTGFGPKPDLTRLMHLNANIHGIYVGSVAHFAAMNKFIGERTIKPVIDQIFPFEAAAAAYEYLRSARHFGKVVIRA